MIQFNNIKGDIFGGITAGIVALPLALAFGIQAFSGIGADGASIGAYAGLVGATLLGFFAALFGGTHSQISGPTGPMTVISATLITGAFTAPGGNFSTVLVSMALAAIFCGLFQILFGIIKLGKYVRYIPYPVLSGFMSGIGVIIIIQQLYPLVGQSGNGSMLDLLTGFPAALSHTSITALLLGLGTVLIIYLFPRITKVVPSTLVALIVMTVISLFVDMDGVAIIGEIPSGLPMPFFANASVSLGEIDWGAVLSAAIIPGLTLAGLGSIDTLLTSVVADNITKTKHNSNQELIGQGIGNAVAGLFCGLPGAGATMRTVVNVKSGGRTQLSGMVHALFLLAIMLGLGFVVKYVPLSVLAGILLTVGWGIIDFKGFKDLPKIPRADAVVLIVVFLVTVFVDLLTAVGIGMVIACVLFMKRASDLVEGGYSSQELTGFDKESPWSDEGGMPDTVAHKIYVQRLNGPIFFGTINKFKEVMQTVPEEARIVIIRMRLVSFMDQSGLYAMEEAIKDLQDRGVEVLMTIIQPQPLYMLQTHHVIPAVVPEEHTFKTFEDCTDYLARKLKNEN
ncbi:MAG: SulP family inorganic anion transporter [Bacteroidales bacterium]|nr:SulP family inorganic anion transporter [Bacteroidales bacterium]